MDAPPPAPTMDASTSDGASMVGASLFLKNISFRVWMVVVGRYTSKMGGEACGVGRDGGGGVATVIQVVVVRI